MFFRISVQPGIAALGQEAVERIVKTVAVFDNFCHVKGHRPPTG